MNTSNVFTASRRYIVLLASVLLMALTGCGGGGDSTYDYSASDSPAHSSSRSVSDLAAILPAGLNTVTDDASTASTASTVSTKGTDNVLGASVVVPVAPPLAGSVIEITASRANLNLGLFSDEVRLALDNLATRSGTQLQWIARFPARKGVQHAYVTVVAVHSGAVVANAFSNSSSRASGKEDDQFAHTDGKSAKAFVLSPEQLRELICVRGSANSQEQFYQAMQAYDDATEAMAVGLVVGTSRELVTTRLYQLQDDEVLLPIFESEARKEARSAIRQKRYESLSKCRQG